MYIVVPISEPQRRVSWPLRLGSPVQIRSLMEWLCLLMLFICCLLMLFITLAVFLCQLCVALPFAQGSDEVPFPSWNLATLDEKECSQVTLQMRYSQVCQFCVIQEHLFHHFPQHSWFYSFLKCASYLSGVLLPQIFPFNSHILAGSSC